MNGLARLLADPHRGRHAAGALLALLCLVTLLLQLALDVEGALDTDTINFGLAAFRFDVLDHQPHPPGYPGYVLYLKVLHAVAPGLGPVEVAKWGSRLAGMASVVAAYFACQQAAGAPAELARGRGLAASLLATVHPILWYYGADGQTHAAEALLTLVLFAAILRAGRASMLRWRLVVIAAMGLAGSVRPTIPLLLAPALIWLLWRRPCREWALAIVAGVAAVVLWYAPLIALCGGLETYARVSEALVVRLFVSQFSVLSGDPRMALLNATLAIQYALLCALPLATWSWRDAPTPWLRPLAMSVGAALFFYMVLYIAEPGYLSGVAALCCLAPASWGRRPRALGGLRLAAVAAFSVLFVVIGPASWTVWGTDIPAMVPTLRHVANNEAIQVYYRKVVCSATGGLPSVVLSDNVLIAHSRSLPLYCHNAVQGHYFREFLGRKDIDAWMFFDGKELFTVPTKVPLESGPPTVARLPVAVERIVVAPDASRSLQAEVMNQATCPPVARVGDAGLPEAVVYPASCLPRLTVGSHTLVLPTRRGGSGR